MRMHAGPSRRTFLKILPAAALGVLNLFNGKELRAEESPVGGKQKSVRSLVFFNLVGGISPWESLTPFKDNVPAEFRGPARTIPTKHGLRVSEYFPKFAEVMHHTALIRSVDSESSDHFQSARNMWQRDGKSFGALYGDRLARGSLPYTMFTAPSIYQIMDAYSDAMAIKWSNDTHCFRPPIQMPDPEKAARLAERRSLLADLDKLDPVNEAMRKMQENYHTAFSLLLGGGSMDDHFIVSGSDHDRYGKSIIGEATAIASRLAESGAGIVVVYNERGNGWDMHGDLDKKMKEMAPESDQAMAALLEDARERNFAVLYSSEFGRTPRMNGGAGRDHHSVHWAAFAGGNTQEGAVYGNHDGRGEISDGRVTHRQLMTTALKIVGLEPKADEQATLVRGVFRE